MDKERESVVRRASSLYERGIVELELQIFLEKHSTNASVGKKATTFTCPGFVGSKQIQFTELMNHWRVCPLHSSLPIPVTKHVESSIVSIHATQADVEFAIDNLYNTLSDLTHFIIPETYPIRIHRFANRADTFAMISFCKFYNLPFTVVPNQPETVGISDSTSSVATKSV